MKYYPSEELVEEEIKQCGKAAQIFEIEIQYMSEKIIMKGEINYEENTDFIY